MAILLTLTCGHLPTPTRGYLPTPTLGHLAYTDAQWANLKKKWPKLFFCFKWLGSCLKTIFNQFHFVIKQKKIVLKFSSKLSSFVFWIFLNILFSALLLCATMRNHAQLCATMKFLIDKFLLQR